MSEQRVRSTAALAVTRADTGRESVVATMCEQIRTSAGAGAGIIVFSEAAVTGFVATGDPDHDRGLAETVPGPTTALLAEAARAARIGATALLVNHLAGTGQHGAPFGGALLIGADGAVLARHPLHTDGVLLAPLPGRP